ncbi:MAG: hypothetical protein VYE73_03835 [Acidobacteriota bacterium]|nr:hypothetical protein [Acidobacteriota bacterium]
MGYTTGGFILNKQIEDSRGRWKRVEYSGNYVSVWRRNDEGGWELTDQSATYRPDWAR